MIIRTVLGDVRANQFGRILGHEHLFTGPPRELTDPDLRLRNETMAMAELQAFKTAGGSAVVEMTTVDYGRDIAALARISRGSQIHVIAATGYNKAAYSDRLTANLSCQEIASWMQSEVCGGASGTAHRCGVIKAASSLDGAGPHERRVFEAAAAAHHATGAPISTHTEAGTWALEQMRLLADHGVKPQHMLLGHLDRKPDIGYLRDVGATGAYMGFDQCGKHKYLPDADRIRLIVALLEAGHRDQLILSGDMARRSSLQAYGGGPGYRHILGTLVPELRAAGLTGDDIDALTEINARRLLSFVPLCT